MAKKEAKQNKEKKNFFKGFKSELKKVIWPTPKQLVNNTIAVITIVLITAIIVFVLDLTFEAINKQGINKVKELIENSSTTSEENNTTENEENTENSENESQENVENSENSKDSESQENEETENNTNAE